MGKSGKIKSNLGAYLHPSGGQDVAPIMKGPENDANDRANHTNKGWKMPQGDFQKMMAARQGKPVK